MGAGRDGVQLDPLSQSAPPSVTAAGRTTQMPGTKNERHNASCNARRRENWFQHASCDTDS
jgi:hypothetical protein